MFCDRHPTARAKWSAAVAHYGFLFFCQHCWDKHGQWFRDRGYPFEEITETLAGSR